MNFLNKVVIVTGSGSGIGAATALAFAKEGANVVLVDRDEEKMKNVSRKCESIGKKPLVVKADLSIDGDVKRIIAETINKFGKLDILVNNAGIVEEINITSEDFMESYDRTMNINLRAAVYMTYLALPHLIKTKGNIVNLSSIAGSSILGSPAFVSYCTSKAGINHFSRGVALEAAAHGVRVNIISPGPVRTNILDTPAILNVTWEHFKEGTALKRLSNPEEIAEHIMYLASDKAKNITGSNLLADNGFLLKN